MSQAREVKRVVAKLASGTAAQQRAAASDLRNLFQESITRPAAVAQLRQALASSFADPTAIANIASLVSNTSKPCFEAVGVFSELVVNEAFVKSIIKDHKQALQAVLDHMASDNAAWQLVALDACRNLAQAGNTALRTVAEMGGIEKITKLLINAVGGQTRLLAAQVLQAYTLESTTRA